MLSFLLVFTISKELNSKRKLDADEILQRKYDKIQKQLDLLENLKNEVISLKRLRNGNIIRTFDTEEKGIALVSINKERTKEYEASSIFPRSKIEAVTVESRAPILHYKLIAKSSNQRTFATKINIKYRTITSSNIKQCVFKFINATQSSYDVSFETQPIDLPKSTEPFVFDLETEVEFTDLEVNVLLNRGDKHYTSIPNINVYGPIHGFEE